MRAVPFDGILLMLFPCRLYYSVAGYLDAIPRYTCICTYVGAYRIHTCQLEDYHGGKPYVGRRIAVIACDQAK
jgi:hypothetical protein